MKIGGVQKSLLNLLNEIENKYDITLLLFNKSGDLIDKIPSSVKVIESKGPFRFFGISQGECKGKLIDYLTRGILVLYTRILGRNRTINLMLKKETKILDSYDCAISYLHNGRQKAFYGGTQEYVLHCVTADKKIAFLHGDYLKCGANCKENNAVIELFDMIAACSDGCKRAVESALPHLRYKFETVCNCHNFDEIYRMASDNPIKYDDSYVNVVIVSRLSHEKGIDRAIRALSKAIERGHNVKLHIVGNGAMREKLCKLVKDKELQDSVVFYGEQSNPYRYMKNADLLLMTSYHEAAPLVIDEARSLGVPTLTTETTSSKEMVEERACGWVCKNSQKELDEAFESVIANKVTLAAIKERLLTINANNDAALRQFENMLCD